MCMVLWRQVKPLPRGRVLAETLCARVLLAMKVLRMSRAHAQPEGNGLSRSMHTKIN